MSLYKGHLAGGSFAFLIYLGVLIIFFAYEPSYDVLIWFGLCILGSIWPDVDTNSMGQKIFYGMFIVLDSFFLITGRYVEAALLGFFALLPVVAKHRGWTHTLSAAFLVPSPLLVLPLIRPDLPFGGLEYYIPVVIGYLSHLALDRQFRLF